MKEIDVPYNFYVSDQNNWKSEALFSDRPVGGEAAENKASSEDRWRDWKCCAKGKQAGGA